MTHEEDGDWEKSSGGSQFKVPPPVLTLFSSSSLHRTARNSRPLEVLGTYDPIPKKDTYDPSGKLHKDVKLDMTRAKYWIGVGAQPTDTARRILSLVCLSQSIYPYSPPHQGNYHTKPILNIFPRDTPNVGLTRTPT